MSTKLFCVQETGSRETNTGSGLQDTRGRVPCPGGVDHAMPEVKLVRCSIWGMRFGCFLLWAWHTRCKGGIPSGLNGKERPEENKLANSSEQQKSERTARPSRPHVPRGNLSNLPALSDSRTVRLVFSRLPIGQSSIPMRPLSSTHVLDRDTAPATVATQACDSGSGGCCCQMQAIGIHP
jgi:hypothetical protein